MKRFLIVLLLPIAMNSQNKKNDFNKSSSIKMLKKFIKKEKFNKDDKLFYSGISSKLLKEKTNELINKSANDFIEILKTTNYDDIALQNSIKTSLKRFNTIYLKLDSEDLDRVCYYFEEMMDIINLKSSGGHLNKFRYGFDFQKNKN